MFNNLYGNIFILIGVMEYIEKYIIKDKEA